MFSDRADTAPRPPAIASNDRDNVNWVNTWLAHPAHTSGERDRMCSRHLLQSGEYGNHHRHPQSEEYGYCFSCGIHHLQSDCAYVAQAMQRPSPGLGVLGLPENS